MIHSLRKIFLMVVLISVVSCDNLFFDDSPTTEPVEVYDAFIYQLSIKNPFLQYLPMNVDSLFAAHRSEISRDGSGKQLVRSFEEILNILQDAHTTLEYNMPHGRMEIRYDEWRTKYPENKLEDISEYFDSYTIIGGNRIEYGKLKSENIGYLKFNSLSLGWLTADVRSILESFQATDGLILDLRSTANSFYNYSSSYEVDEILEMLCDSSGAYLYTRAKKFMPGNEYFDWEPVSLHLPNNSDPVYTDQVVALTNRETAGPVESLAAGLRLNTSTQIIGDTTAGFIRNPDFERLVGDWHTTVSYIEVKLPENYQNSSHRFQGIPPDIVVNISPEDSSAGIDTILERAIEELKK